MAIRKIITGRSKRVLRNNAKDIASVTGPIALLVKDMQKTLANTENGIGLAAPQVSELLRLFVILPKLSEEVGGHAVYINPEITKTSRKTVEEEEGCLSIPGEWGVVPRAEKVTIKAQDVDGKVFKVIGKGILARLFQHEVDHLRGVLYIDYVKETQKEEI